MADWKECRHCGHIHDKSTCPKCEKQHQDTIKSTIVTSQGRRLPPKYGWGG